VDVGIGVLGPLQVVIDGVDVTPRAPKERALLVMLVINRDRVVSVDRLVEELWPKLDADRARRVLQVRVAALRKRLNVGEAAPTLTYVAQGYRLALQTGDVDESQFFALVGQARAQSAAGDTADALVSFRAALDLWRGEPLADLHGCVSHEAEAARLREARLVAVEDRIDAELACGHHREVAAELDALVTTYPLRERLWEQHILASYRCGRQAEALRACSLVRRRLVDELGVEPGPGLRGLEASVLEQKAVLDWKAEMRPGPSRRSRHTTAVDHLPDVHYARTLDGVNIAYRVVGGGPFDLIVVPGFTSHLDMWWRTPTRRLIRRLASSMRVILFDKRGMGLSDRPPDIDVDHWVHDMQAVLDAVGSRRASVLGFSAGGLIAVQYAATYPDRVGSLVLYGAWARLFRANDYPLGTTPEGFERTLERIEANWGSAVGIEELCPSVSDDPAARAKYGWYQRLSASPGAAVSYLRALAASDVRQALSSVAAPTLVLHATGDRSVPVEMARYMAARMPHAAFVELESNDHLIWFSDVIDVITARVQDFLAGTVPPPEMNRAVACVLFVDLVDQERPRTMPFGRPPQNVLVDLEGDANRLIDRFRGRRIRREDDILATFDGPARAIRCASTFVEEFRDLGLVVRAGLHSGECEITGNDVAGVAVQIARQVANRASPGQVLVSQTVRDLVLGSAITFSEPCPQSLEGAPGRWNLYAVTGA
jgi:pimeloyl-ACP methyl ester carboxylesterase/DNA-binding SARP family transcriptional activator